MFHKLHDNAVFATSFRHPRRSQICIRLTQTPALEGKDAAKIIFSPPADLLCPSLNDGLFAYKCRSQRFRY
jgi:hypothetical protein